MTFPRTREISREDAKAYYLQLKAKSPDVAAWKDSEKMKAQCCDSTLDDQPPAITKIIVPKSFESTEGKLIKWIGIIVIIPYIILIGFFIVVVYF